MSHCDDPFVVCERSVGAKDFLVDESSPMDESPLIGRILLSQLSSLFTYRSIIFTVLFLSLRTIPHILRFHRTGGWSRMCHGVWQAGRDSWSLCLPTCARCARTFSVEFPADLTCYLCFSCAFTIEIISKIIECPL